MRNAYHDLQAGRAVPRRIKCRLRNDKRISRDDLSAVQRAVALFDPSGTCSSSPSASRILRLLLESVGYDGSTGDLELAFYPLGITSLAAEAAMIGRSDAAAAA